MWAGLQIFNKSKVRGDLIIGFETYEIISFNIYWVNTQ